MTVVRTVGAALAGYALGTIPSADLAARAASAGRLDLRHMGSRNPGTMNALYTLGRGWGIAVGAADIAKGVAACALGRRLGGGTAAHVAGVAAVAGHCYPVWTGFRGGGKGVATSLGQCLATFPAYAAADTAVAVVAAAYLPPRRRALTTTFTSAALWIASGVLWWRKRLPNGWGPEPTIALPLASVATTVLIGSRFVSAVRAGEDDDLGDHW